MGGFSTLSANWSVFAQRFPRNNRMASILAEMAAHEARIGGKLAKDCVLRMREHGLKATGCNSVIRSINAYLKWSGSPLKIPSLKEPQLILPTFTAAHVKLLVSWRPKIFYQRRLHLLVLFLLDTGCRISEALSLRVSEIDFDKVLVTLDGKGESNEWCRSLLS